MPLLAIAALQLAWAGVGPQDWTITTEALGTRPAARLRSVLPIRTACRDRRFPRLAGPFIVYCGARGHVDRFLDLQTGETITLDPRPTHPWTGPSVLASAIDGVWRLPDAQPSDRTALRLPSIGPPTVTSEQILVPTADALHVRTFDSSSWRRVPAEMAPWSPAALLPDRAVWTVLGSEQSDLYSRDESGQTVPIATGPGHQHHPVGEDSRLAWVDDGDVVVVDTETGKGRRYEASAGAVDGPTFTGAHVCWTERAATPQVRCSDGFSAPGHRPSGAGHLLLVHEGSHVTLYAASQMPLRRASDATNWVAGPLLLEWEGPEGWTREESVGSRVRALPSPPLPAGIPQRGTP